MLCYHWYIFLVVFIFRYLSKDRIIDVKEILLKVSLEYSLTQFLTMVIIGLLFILILVIMRKIYVRMENLTINYLFYYAGKNHIGAIKVTIFAENLYKFLKIFNLPLLWYFEHIRTKEDQNRTKIQTFLLKYYFNKPRINPILYLHHILLFIFCMPEIFFSGTISIFYKVLPLYGLWNYLIKYTKIVLKYNSPNMKQFNEHYWILIYQDNLLFYIDVFDEEKMRWYPFCKDAYYLIIENKWGSPFPEYLTCYEPLNGLKRTTFEYKINDFTKATFFVKNNNTNEYTNENISKYIKLRLRKDR